MIDFDTLIKANAAASDKSSAEMTAEIISNLRQHNYGIAEHNAAILIARLEYEEQERQEAKARSEETKSDDFEQTIQGFIKNLEKTIVDQPCDDYFAGMKNAYLYALAMHERTQP